MDGNLPLWCFLHAAKIDNSPPRLTIDLKELRKRAGVALSMGFADEQDENMPEEFRRLMAQMQSVYRAWNIRESELDKIRPFFTDERLREKILPLEIVRMAGQHSVKASTPSKLNPKPTLSLKQRSPSTRST
jgi:hypothetical protein